MEISTNGLAVVKAFEGCLKPVGGGRITTYYCPASVLTIGYGHTNLGGVPPRIAPGDVWTKAQCDAALAADMGKFERHVSGLAPEITDQNRFDALVSWSFNCGGPASSAVWTYARRGDVAGTQERLKRWTKGGGRVLPGLVRRREAEAELFAGHVDRAFLVAQIARGPEPMPQRADVPRPPASEIARRTKGEAATAAAGGATAGTVATTETSEVGASLATWAAIGVGVALALIGVALAIRKARIIRADWA